MSKRVNKFKDGTIFVTDGMSVELNGEVPVEIMELVEIENKEFDEIRGNPHSIKATQLIKKYGKKLTPTQNLGNI